MNFGPHASFIVSAYLVVVVVVALLIGWVLVDYRRQRATLAELEASGVTRRSARGARAGAVSETVPDRKNTSRLWLAVPFVVFAALVALFALRLGAGDPSRIPSALIGRPAPATTLPSLVGLTRDGADVPGLDAGAFAGRVSVVNVWASWCVPCHDEAPLLMQLASDPRIQIVGINYKDTPDNARRFLGRYGNPFRVVGTDANGRAAIEWGVYGVPETFIVGSDGRIAYKLIGPITPDNMQSVLRVEIEKALSRKS